MNDQDLLVESLRKLAYNEYLKPFYSDLEDLAKLHPKVVIMLAYNSGSPKEICDTINSFMFDSNDETREIFHPHTAYLLMTIFTNHRPTPNLPIYYDE